MRLVSLSQSSGEGSGCAEKWKTLRFCCSCPSSGDRKKKVARMEKEKADRKKPGGPNRFQNKRARTGSDRPSVLPCRQVREGLKLKLRLLVLPEPGLSLFQLRGSCGVREPSSSSCAAILCAWRYDRVMRRCAVRRTWSDIWRRSPITTLPVRRSNRTIVKARIVDVPERFLFSGPG